MKKIRKYIGSFVVCFVLSMIYGQVLFHATDDKMLVGLLFILTHSLGYTLWLEKKGDK